MMIISVLSSIELSILIQLQFFYSRTHGKNSIDLTESIEIGFPKFSVNLLCTIEQLFISTTDPQFNLFLSSKLKISMDIAIKMKYYLKKGYEIACPHFRIFFQIMFLSILSFFLKLPDNHQSNDDNSQSKQGNCYSKGYRGIGIICK